MASNEPTGRVTYRTRRPGGSGNTPADKASKKGRSKPASNQSKPPEKPSGRALTSSGRGALVPRGNSLPAPAPKGTAVVPRGSSSLTTTSTPRGGVPDVTPRVIRDPGTAMTEGMKTVGSGKLSSSSPNYRASASTALPRETAQLKPPETSTATSKPEDKPRSSTQERPNKPEASKAEAPKPNTSRAEAPRTNVRTTARSGNIGGLPDIPSYEPPSRPATSPIAARVGRGLGNVARAAGRLALPVGIGMAAYEGLDALRKDQIPSMASERTRQNLEASARSNESLGGVTRSTSSKRAEERSQNRDSKTTEAPQSRTEAPKPAPQSRTEAPKPAPQSRTEAPKPASTKASSSGPKQTPASENRLAPGASLGDKIALYMSKGMSRQEAADKARGMKMAKGGMVGKPKMAKGGCMTKGKK